MASDPKFHQVDAAVVPRFADVATFMRTRRHDISAEVDIGLIGVPFDIGVNFRAGARQGPAGVREASRLIRKAHPTSGIAPFETCHDFLTVHPAGIPCRKKAGRKDNGK